MKNIVEPHFLSTIAACESACEVLDIMGETDIVETLRELLETQYEIFCHILDGKHYGTDRLNDFLSRTSEIKQEILRIKETK